MALLGMVKVILEEGLEHRGDCRDLVTGLSGPHVLVADCHLDDLAARCDLPRTDIERVAREFATAPRAMAVTRTGASLHLGDTVAEWLGHVLNVVTGWMDRPGGRRYERGYPSLRTRIRRRAAVGGTGQAGGSSQPAAGCNE
jgi:formate dehydrogenase